MTAGALMLIDLSASTPLGLLLGAYAIFGIGFGSVNPPITYTAVSGMPDNQAGVAAAIASTSRQVGQALGVAITGSCSGTLSPHTRILELASASHAAWLLIAGCGIAVLGSGAASTGAWALRLARISSEQMSRESVTGPDAGRLRPRSTPRSRKMTAQPSPHKPTSKSNDSGPQAPESAEEHHDDGGPMMFALRYILPAVVTIAGLVMMAMGSETDLEGGAGFVSAGLAIF